ncbi:MAG: hypothetical protein AAB944_01670, partial [Patescibacteria group bacterium]
FASGSAAFSGLATLYSGFQSTASSTLLNVVNFSTTNATTTNATTTALHVSGGAVLNGASTTISGALAAQAITGTTLTNTAGLFASGTAAISGLASLYSGFQSTASSTLLNVVNYSGTNATSSFLAVSTNASTSQLLVSNGFGVGVSTTTTGGAAFAGTIDVRGTSASSTFANGLNLANGCFSVNGVCIGGSNLTGSGSSNLVARWTSSSNLSTGILYDTGTLSGVSTATPAEEFSVQGDVLISGNIRSVSGLTATGTVDFTRTSAAAATDQLFLSNLSSATATAARVSFRTLDSDNTATTIASITATSSQNYFAASGDLVLATLRSGTLTEGVRLTSTGRLGIGTSTPGFALGV